MVEVIVWVDATSVVVVVGLATPEAALPPDAAPPRITIAVVNTVVLAVMKVSHQEVDDQQKDPHEITPPDRVVVEAVHELVENVDPETTGGAVMVAEETSVKVSSGPLTTSYNSAALLFDEATKCVSLAG